MHHINKGKWKRYRFSSHLPLAPGHPNYSVTNSWWLPSLYILFLFHYCSSKNIRQTLGKETTKPNPYGLPRVRSTPSMSRGAYVTDKGSIVMANASEGSIDLASLLRTNEVEALHTTVICAPGKYLVWTRLSNDNLSWIIKYVCNEDNLSSKWFLRFSSHTHWMEQLL